MENKLPAASLPSRNSTDASDAEGEDFLSGANLEGHGVRGPGSHQAPERSLDSELGTLGKSRGGSITALQRGERSMTVERAAITPEVILWRSSGGIATMMRKRRRYEGADGGPLIRGVGCHP